MTPTVLEAINRQIAAEFNASFSYLAMAAWCEHHQFMGAGKWLRFQSQEEHGHAMKLLNFVLARNYPAKLSGVETPPSDFASIGAVFERALAQEHEVSRQIDALYERIAWTSSNDPGYFAEKYGPGWLPAFTWELYPAAREVIVVRDFRDVLCSILAFNSKRGFDSFGRQRVQTDEEFVAFLGRRIGDLLEAWRQRRAAAHLLRYEDLVLQPDETLDRLLAYLGLERGEKTITSMLDTLSKTSSRMEMHRTTPDPKASIGRWQRDLDPQLRDVSEETFRAALEEFGYLGEPATAAAR